MSYSCSLASRYKCGFIHSAYIDGNEVIRVQVDEYAYWLQVKSYHAAKIIITKYFNKIGRYK